MSITFTITCDTEEELAYVLENLYLQTGGKMPSAKAHKKASATVPVGPGGAVGSGASGQAKNAKKPRSSRQPGLTPLLQEELDKTIAAKKPFRSKDVIDRVMKKHKHLNEKSVTTGINKLLSQSDLKFDTIKNPVGRSFKQYLP
ncbi:MAG: hypothetical protein KC474_00510 [Cyanobacteria bacterium HKST-UBA04]|nr:hypothetical protein [Cyanobacteria bacterium HKST-UBA04]